MEGDVAGYGVGAVGILAVIAQMAWQRFFSAPGKASDALYEQLKEQLKDHLGRIEKLEREVDDERALRRIAELQAASYKLLLVQHGIEVPA